MGFDEWSANWLKIAEERGHKLRRDKDGRINVFEVDAGFHNGPACEACGWSACMHCEDDTDKIPECDAKVGG